VGMTLEQNGHLDALEFIRWRWRHGLSLSDAAGGTRPVKAPSGLLRQRRASRSTHRSLGVQGLGSGETGRGSLERVSSRLCPHYGKPRMTRDLDFVVALMERHADALVSAFSTDLYIDEDAARSAITLQRMFNLMHPG